jgi:hypothetical protein
MRSKKLLLAASGLALMLGASGCDEGLTEINRDPNDPVTVPAQYILADAIMDGVGAAYGSHSEWYGLYLTNLWSQQIAQPIYNDEDLYVPRDAQLNSIWTTFYTQPLADLKVIKEIAAETNSPNLGAVAEVWTQWNFMHLTDTYGDIPYTQALKGDSGTTPAYDAQADVYAAMLQKLTEASQTLDPAGFVSFEEGDLIYGGDIAKWQKFANSLRMRLALRMVNVAPDQAKSEFIAAYEAGGFESNADNATLNGPGTTSSRNQVYEHFTARPLNDFMVSAAMVDRLKAYNDPRLPLYADPTVAFEAGEETVEFRGLPNGKTPGELDMDMKNFSHIGEFFRQATTPSVLLSYAEVLFMEAEAAERGWIPADPAALYRQGITAAMELLDIPDDEIEDYLAQPAVAYDGLPSIWEQLWLSLYLNGGEAWALVRRTGYPELTPSTGDQIPMRLPYPTEEKLYNPDNYKVTSLYDPLWWDK